MKQFKEGLSQTGFQDLDLSERMRLLEAFDAEFYLNQNPGLRDHHLDAFTHYMTLGWRQCRDPSADFNTLEYLLSHRDVLRSGTNPFVVAVLGGNAGGNDESSELSTITAAKQSDLVVRDWEPVLAAADSKGSESRTGSNWSAVPHSSARPTGCESLSEAEINRIRDAFDADYYVQQSRDVAQAKVDPFQHYMSQGWRESRDPNRYFSTEFYLSNYPDIKASGKNPFIHWVLHGIGEKRAGMSFRQRLELKAYAPMVSAIIPNFNHASYLAQRIESILNQTYPHISITILDDCSTDNSREVIDSYVERYPGVIRSIYNDENSGGVFRQWRKGVLETDGDLVWICESDDFCEPDFVEKLVPHFRDESVQIAFGRIQETDSKGVANDELDIYRERAEAGIWERPLVRPAAKWFAGAFGVRNVIANVGGCMWRRAPIAEAIWDQAGTYTVVGDWFLYIQIAGGGKIAWEPEAIAYFRRHGANTSSTSFAHPKFYQELERLMLGLRRAWDIPVQTLRRFHHNIVEQYDWFGVEEQYGPLEKYCSLTKLLSVERAKPHILLAMYGFIPGGGEYFPLFLANGLVECGWTVSMLVFETNETNMHMRRALNPAVSVYESSWITEYGADQFLVDAGISLVHSHTIGAELHFFYMWRSKADVRFLVTLHGSYEASELPHEMMQAITAPVDHFIYTADKNLLPLARLGIPETRLTKMANAMPVDPDHFPMSRQDLGIAAEAIVFTLVARGIKRKGWRAAIEAFIQLRKRCPEQPIHLCLVGTGDEPDRHKKKFGSDRNISFLGFQSRISGLYRMTDVSIVPTRFSGESYPLCIIQALQVGTPVIGSNVGEIQRMLVSDDGTAGGIVIDAVRDTKAFIADLSKAMEKMLDPKVRKRFAQGATALGRNYDMEKVVTSYDSIYRDLLGDRFSQETGGRRQSRPPGNDISDHDNDQSRLMSA